MTETKRVDTRRADVKVENFTIRENTVYDCDDEKAALLNQIIGVTQNLIVKKSAEEITAEFIDDLTASLRDYILNGDDIENLLNTEVDIEDEGTATIAEIAEMYDFDAEQTMALYIGLELVDEEEIGASYLIDSVDSRDFEFYPRATDYDGFGRELFERSKIRSHNDGVIFAIIDTLDFEKFACNYARDSHVVVIDYGAVEIF